MLGCRPGSGGHSGSRVPRKSGTAEDAGKENSVNPKSLLLEMKEHLKEGRKKYPDDKAQQKCDEEIMYLVLYSFGFAVDVSTLESWIAQERKQYKDNPTELDVSEKIYRMFTDLIAGKKPETKHEPPSSFRSQIKPLK